MNEYYNETTFPEYIELIKNQPKIPGQDFEPVLFTDVLPNEENILEIYFLLYR